MKRIIYFLLLLTLFSSQLLRAQDQKTSLSITLKPNEKVLLNTIIDFIPEIVELKNTTQKILTVEKEINAERPIHLFKSELIIDEFGKEEKKINNYLMMIGKRNEINTNQKSTVDSLINISTEDFSINTGQSSQDLISTISLISKDYIKNERNITTHNFDTVISKNYKLLNFNLKFSRLAKIGLDKYNKKESIICDSIMNEVFMNIDSIERVSSPLNLKIYYALLKYSAVKKGCQNTNFWDFINYTDTALRSKVFFKKYLFTQLNSINETEPELLNKYIEEVNKFGINKDEINSFIERIKHPKNELALNKKILLDIINLPIIENLREQKISISKIINESKNKYTLIDFWASWCAPCKSEAPFLFKLEANKYKNISFIQISLDKEKDIKLWRKAIIDLQAPKSIKQYRMLDLERAEFINRLNLKTIPRYIILNSYRA